MPHAPWLLLREIKLAATRHQRGDRQQQYLLVDLQRIAVVADELAVAIGGSCARCGLPCDPEYKLCAVHDPTGDSREVAV